MWKIRKKIRKTAKPSTAEAQDCQPPSPDPAAHARIVGRYLLGISRQAIKWQDELQKTVAAMPADQTATYRGLVTCEIWPSFEEVLRLIDEAERDGLLTTDEAANLRAGKTIEIGEAETRTTA